MVRLSRLVGLSLGLLVMLVGIASAQPRLVVLDFEGPRAGAFRNQVVKGLQQGNVEMVSLSDAEGAARGAGFDLGTSDGLAAAARELQLSAFVRGEVTKVRGKVFEVTVRVYNGADGYELTNASFKGKRARVLKRLKRGSWKRLGDAISSSQPPAARAEEPEEPEEDVLDEEPPPAVEVPDGDDADDEGDEEEEDDDGDGETTDSPALDLRVGMRFVSRDFSYNQMILQLADYFLWPYPSVHGQLRLYPGALFSDGVLAHIGLDVAYTHVLSPASERDGLEFGTSASMLRVGLRGRLPLGDHELGLSFGYESQVFKIEDAQDGTDPQLPSVAYGFLRVGPDLRLALSDSFLVEAEVAYLHGVSFGELAGTYWFPNTSGYAIDVGLRGIWRPVSVFEIYGGAGFRQVGLTFEPDENDPGQGVGVGRVAGGAIDRYIMPELGVTLRI